MAFDMKVLWLTRFLPYPPFYGGDAIYSSKLAEGLAGAGAHVTGLCFENGGDARDSATVNGVDWRIFPLPDRPAWQSIFGYLPSIAHRFRSRAYLAAARAAVGAGVDAVVFDHIGSGWPLAPLCRTAERTNRPPDFIYLSHNHETSVRGQVARHFKGSALKKFALKLEAKKAAELERKMVDASALVTVNTREDEALFRRTHPEKTYLPLTPGYDGPVLGHRTIGGEAPKRAIVVGSFGWFAKRMNLEAFLEAGAARFHEAGAEIEILGNMPDGYGETLRARYPTVRVTGRYDTLPPHLAEARLGIVPEQTGGGFKHKVLSYIFNRLPVAALEGSVAGLPLRPGESILTAKTMAGLVTVCLAALDDMARLNALQNRAFAACAGQFDWASRGRAFWDAIRRLRNEAP